MTNFSVLQMQMTSPFVLFRERLTGLVYFLLDGMNKLVDPMTIRWPSEQDMITGQ